MPDRASDMLKISDTLRSMEESEAFLVTLADRAEALSAGAAAKLDGAVEP